VLSYDKCIINIHLIPELVSNVVHKAKQMRQSSQPVTVQSVICQYTYGNQLILKAY